MHVPCRICGSRDCVTRLPDSAMHDVPFELLRCGYVHRLAHLVCKPSRSTLRMPRTQPASRPSLPNRVSQTLGLDPEGTDMHFASTGRLSGIARIAAGAPMAGESSSAECAAVVRTVKLFDIAPGAAGVPTGSTSSTACNAPLVLMASSRHCVWIAALALTGRSRSVVPVAAAARMGSSHTTACSALVARTADRSGSAGTAMVAPTESSRASARIAAVAPTERSGGAAGRAAVAPTSG
mmetsp:Transcript_67498/g.208825  ORF Transcript_67498/g.208825 Transcript_67498/m.208825 type:complete len:238 (+) Transcript_67498:28-741(+)